MIQWKAEQVGDDWYVLEYSDGKSPRSIMNFGPDNPPAGAEAFARRIARLLELEAIVDKLHKTKDGVPVVQSFDKVWFWHDGQACCQVIASDCTTLGGTIRECYSTEVALLEAAEAARKEAGS